MKRFQIITVYSDLTCKTESTSDLAAALNAASIYWMDEDCISVKIYDWEQQKDCMVYTKP